MIVLIAYNEGVNFGTPPTSSGMSTGFMFMSFGRKLLHESNGVAMNVTQEQNEEIYT